MLVQDFLYCSALRSPEKTAVISGGQRLSYAELDKQSNQLAHALREHGILRGDRVALFLPNSLAMAVAIFGTLKAGAVFVPINHTTKREKLIHILQNCRTAALITDARGVAQSCAAQIRLDVPSLRCVVVDSEASTQTFASPDGFLDFNGIRGRFASDPPKALNIDLDLACLIYTSGSTGEPKGVMTDHSNVVFLVNSITNYLENTCDDVLMNVLPLSFSYGLYQLLMMVKCGGTLILENGFVFPTSVLKSIEVERVTGFPAVPTMLTILLRLDLSSYDLSSLRYITNAAAALPTIRVHELGQKLPKVKFFSMYGLTETKRALYLPPEQLTHRPGSVGIPIPGTEAWLEDESGNRLGVGKIGELVVRGRHVMRGYWECPELTSQRFRPGPVAGERLCYTDDLFRMDEEGYFYFVGRKDDIIKSGGEKIAPKEIEHVLYGLAGIVEAAVIGIPDPLLGQAIKAIIVTNDVCLSETQVFAHCHAHLEDHMVPKRIEFRSELPKTPSGKITKTGLS